jgi:isopropylmalate/homocitrate/citramalate synthase
MTDEIWTGEINDAAAIGGSVGLYDTTLRDGEQTVGVVLDPEQKLEIALALDELGVDRIEAGFPRVSPEDRRAVELIQGAGLNAEVWGFSRALPADVDALIELDVRAAVIEAPVSERKLGALQLDHAEVLRRIAGAVSHATQNGMTIAFFGVDGTRAERSFLETVYKTAVEAGAQEAVIVDTIGVASPEAVSSLVSAVHNWLGPSIPIHFHGHNDFGLAAPPPGAAGRARRRRVHGTINGMGERAGNANLGEVALALHALYGTRTNLRLDRVRDVSRKVRELSGYALEPWKPVVGENLFTRESGAVASQFHDPPAIEPFSSELVAADRRIVLGKKSGIDSIRIKLDELGLDVPEEQHRDLLAEVKRLATERKGLVPDDVLRRLVEG